MKKQKVITSSARLDEFREVLQGAKKVSSAVREITHDKRSLRSTQSAERALSGKYKTSEIAQELGLSTQKWVAIRKQIRAGNAYSPEIRDLLRAGINEKKQEEQQEVEKIRIRKAQSPRTYTVEESINGEVNRKTAKVYSSLKQVQELIGYADPIKLCPDKKSAALWWLKIGAGSDYFVLARETRGSGKGGYWVVDIRSPEEKASKGELNGQTRALEVLKDFKKDFNNYLDRDSLFEDTFEEDDNNE